MRWLIVLLTFGSYVLANEPLFISIGCHCEAAVLLKENHLRKASYPFDWLITHNAGRIAELLDRDFEGFMDEIHCFHHPEYPDVFENAYYEIEWRHDYPKQARTPLAIHLDEIRPKYERRIDRFRALKGYPGKVFFVRTAYDAPHCGPNIWMTEDNLRVSSADTRVLKEALTRFFPNLDFTLVVVNYREDMMTPIDRMEGVVEFKIRKSHRHEDYIRFIRLLQKDAQCLP